ncbi:alpha-glucoside transport system permease protein [Actinomadura luteofluorescens]|uniref:Alpha-glucoside transport system permease protein n=1 Tax=Actinomadura luteofluorescens TaxID=46163 RepID=A0A7Y9EAD9_9ACTN|nr:ABC transporter permease subunit [Actinomadura luteofluorescens]NYD44058.1 alpha-glucoside transport system permease protein [Actinomadura luteofluorescens]
MKAPNEEVPPAATAGGAAAIDAPPARPGPRGARERLTPPSWLALTFLLPALLLLGFLVVYPIVYSVIRSFFDASGDSFVGVDNYTGVFQGHDNLVAVRNTAIWVVVAPTVVTIIGLVFAVLTERIRWATVFKLVVFMPMAISFLASGVIFRLVYQQDPDKGVANAAMVAVHDMFRQDTTYPGAGPRNGGNAPVRQDGGAVVSVRQYSAGQSALVPLLKIKPEYLPKDARPAAQPPAAEQGELTGTVWFDFTRGGGGQQNAPNSGESGLPGIRVEAVQGGKVVAKATTEADGTFTLRKVPAGTYAIRLPKDNFTTAYQGAEWLGDTLITPAIIGSYLWVWSGFAMVLIAAGLAAIPRDALEAARVDGATEWQVFRRVTIPLLAPVLMVVLVTLVINVLKVFDLVYIIGGGDPNASVLALQMWTESFGGGNDQGSGSAIAVLLFVLVLPAMLFNIRRMRQERK